LKKIHLKGPATIGNVGPGFDIFALSLKKPFDEFTIELIDSKEITVEIKGNVPGLPTTPMDNTGSLAIIHMLEELGINEGIQITIEKKMPIGSGLGSSGASAAACVYGVNRLLNLGLGENEMVDIARKGEVASGGSPHADNVAGALLGGFIFIKSYNPMEICRIEIPDIPVVINVIKKKERTTRGFINEELPLSDIREQSSHCAAVIHSLMNTNIKDFGKAISYDFISEPVRANAIPGYWQIKEKILENGAYGFNICGGGSSVFAICSRENKNRIAEILYQEISKQNIKPYIIKTETGNEGIKEIK
jgi:homoserine kinase